MPPSEFRCVLSAVAAEDRGKNQGLGGQRRQSFEWRPSRRAERVYQGKPPYKCSVRWNRSIWDLRSIQQKPKEHPVELAKTGMIHGRLAWSLGGGWLANSQSDPSLRYCQQLFLRVCIYDVHTWVFVCMCGGHRTTLWSQFSLLCFPGIKLASSSLLASTLN